MSKRCTHWTSVHDWKPTRVTDLVQHYIHSRRPAAVRRTS